MIAHDGVPRAKAYDAIKAFNAALKHYTTDANYAAHLADSQGALGT